MNFSHLFSVESNEVYLFTLEVKTGVLTSRGNRYTSLLSTGNR